MNKTSSYFFALPTDIYDALISSQQKYPMARLRELALSKGLVISPQLDREAVCMRIAQLSFSYKEFKGLSDNLMVKARAPRSESTSLNQHISNNHIVNVMAKLKKEYPNKAFNVDLSSSGATKITMQYDEFNHGQTRLKQRQTKESVVELSVDDKEKGTGKIISSATPQARSFITSLIKFLEDDEGLNITAENIDLSNFTTSQINNFFIRLAESIPDLGFTTAKSVKVQRADNEEEPEAVTESAGGSLLTEIKNASLAGSNVLESSQVREFLSANEYHIHTLSWESIEVPVEGTDGAVLLIELKATPPDKCSNFQFDVVGFKHRSKLNNQFVKKFSHISRLAKAGFIKMIHKRAFELYQEILDETSVEQS